MFLERLAIGAQRAGWRCHLVCRPARGIDRWCGGLAEAGIRVTRLGMSARGAARLFGILRRAEAVHLTLAFPVGKWQLLATLLARAAGRPPVITHQLAVDVRMLPLPAWRRALWRRLHRAYGVLGRRHLAISRHARELLVELLGYPSDRVLVVHNGVEVAAFACPPPEERRTLRERLLGSDSPLFCSVARLSRQKGLFDLLAAARRVVELRPGARLVVLGEGEERAALEARRRELGLEGVVMLPGSVDREELAAWLAACNAFVLASHFEGGPAIAVMEALAAGCPAVVTDAGGVDELVSGLRFVTVVPPGQPDRLAAAMFAALESDGIAVLAAAEGPARVAEAWTWEACVRDTLAALPRSGSGAG